MIFAARLLAVLSILCLLRAANAFDLLSFTIQKLESDSWQAEQLRFTLDWPSLDRVGYRLEVGRLVLPDLRQTLHGLRIDCEEGLISDEQISCIRGLAYLPLEGLDNPSMTLSFRLDQASGRLEGKLQEISIAGGQAQVDFVFQENQWKGRVQGRQLQLESLLTLLPVEQRPPQEWSYSGELNGEIHYSGRDGELLISNWKVALTHLAFSDVSGEFAGEALGADLRGSLERSSGGWQVSNELSLKQGEMLTPVFYLSAASHPLQLETRFSLDEGLHKIRVENALLELAGLLSLKARGELDLAAQQRLQRLSLQVQPFQMGDVYQELLQPVLFGTPWGGLAVEGTTQLSLRMEGEMQSLDLGLDDFHLDDADTNEITRRMGLYGVNGRLHWNQGGEPRPSWLAWQRGHLLERIDLGAGRIDFQVYGKDFSLSRQAIIPVIDGALVVDGLDIQDLGSPEQKLQFDGIIEPISMQALSEAMGWLPLSGKLSGIIPGLTHKNDQLKLEGVLLVRIFDGDILIRELRLQDLFGIYPQLKADIELNNLDLETLTNTLSFGKITGRLDGYVKGLSLEAWQPVEFDALFYTPEDDKSRHRISQKAVDNISNLGGAGLSGTVARSFLGMFEEFRYKRIGIGCRLQGESCEMVGVGEAKQGYYLVEGSGIPRIDIIGYNRTADWPRLVEQLKQITESGSPVIE